MLCALFNDAKGTLPSMILEDYLRIGEQRFIDAGIWLGHGTDNAWDEAVMLAFYVLDLPPDSDRSVLASEVTAAEGEQIMALFERRIEARLPAPYMTGWAWFCGMPFRVDERVLVPRSPLGELIEDGFSKWLQQPPVSILDLCCGSGCIGIAAAHRFPEARVVLADISGDALDVARENIALHEVGDRVTAIQSDCFDNIEGRFDLILCNPPYVDEGDFSGMPAEYHHEPALALESGTDGMDFTRRLIAEAGRHLTPGGWLFGEVGNSWPALVRAFPQLPLTEIDLVRGGQGVYCLANEFLQG